PVFARSRLHARLRHNPRQPCDDLGRRHFALLARFGTGQRLRRDLEHRRPDLALLGDPRDAIADRHLGAPLQTKGYSPLSRPPIVIRGVPKIDFMRWHLLGFALSGLLSIITVVIFLTAGLNYGIDFTGGTLIEVRTTSGPADLAAMRSKLD